MDFETLDDQNFLISFTDLTGLLFVRSHPRRHLPFPRHRVEGHRHQRQRTNEPIQRFIRFRTSV
jgi:hypothetical protein